MRRGVLIALFGATVLLSGCSSSAKSQAGLPPAPPVITVHMEDNRFTFDPAIPTGRVVFEVRNVGKVLHNVVILPLPENLPPLEEQLRGQDRQFVEPFASVRPVRPGDSRSIAVDLGPGRRYGIICSVTDAEGKSHALKGMSAEFRASPVPAQQTEPGQG